MILHIYSFQIVISFIHNTMVLKNWNFEEHANLANLLNYLNIVGILPANLARNISNSFLILLLKIQLNLDHKSFELSSNFNKCNFFDK